MKTKNDPSKAVDDIANNHEMPISLNVHIPGYKIPDRIPVEHFTHTISKEKFFTQIHMRAYVIRV